MKKSLTTVNTAFREWTRGVSFTLVMGKTQVGALVSVHASRGSFHFVGSGHRLHRRFISGVRGLEDRGLVVHHPERIGQQDIGQIFEVTTAGEGVVTLLQITGVYQDILKEFEASDGHDVLAEARKKVMRDD